MKFQCVFVNKRTNKVINKDFTVDQIDKYMGEYIKDRAIKRGHTTTTVVKRGDNNQNNVRVKTTCTNVGGYLTCF
jgi:hypothetical protein